MGIFLTIYTDASWCMETKAGGWASWIKNAPGESILQSGRFKGAVQNHNHAEMMAIANGLAVAKKVYKAADRVIVVVTDSQTAIDYIEMARMHEDVPPRTGKRGGVSSKKRDPHLFKLGKTIWGLVPTGATLRVNKVAAHSHQDGKRSYVNDMVDRAAKKKMQEDRNLKLKG